MDKPFPEEIETDRLVLRTFVESDIDVFRRIYADPEVMAFMSTGIKSADDAAGSIRRKVDHWKKHGYGMWCVVEKVTGVPIGHCGLGWLDPIAEIEVAYLLDKSVWGKNLATEAVRASISCGFDYLGRERLIAIAPPDHSASRRVMEKCGMRFVDERSVWNKVFVYYETKRKNFRAVARSTFPGSTYRLRCPR